MSKAIWFRKWAVACQSLHREFWKTKTKRTCKRNMTEALVGAHSSGALSVIEIHSFLDTFSGDRPEVEPLQQSSDVPVGLTLRWGLSVLLSFRAGVLSPPKQSPLAPHPPWVPVGPSMRAVSYTEGPCSARDPLEGTVGLAPRTQGLSNAPRTMDSRGG